MNADELAAIFVAELKRELRGTPLSNVESDLVEDVAWEIENAQANQHNPQYRKQIRDRFCSACIMGSTSGTECDDLFNCGAGAAEDKPGFLSVLDWVDRVTPRAPAPAEPNTFDPDAYPFF